MHHFTAYLAQNEVQCTTLTKALIVKSINVGVTTGANGVFAVFKNEKVAPTTFAATTFAKDAIYYVEFSTKTAFLVDFLIPAGSVIVLGNSNAGTQWVFVNIN